VQHGERDGERLVERAIVAVRLDQQANGGPSVQPPTNERKRRAHRTSTSTKNLHPGSQTRSLPVDASSDDASRDGQRDGRMAPGREA
jgi:hypothetical protein